MELQFFRFFFLIALAWYRKKESALLLSIRKKILPPLEVMS